MDKYVRNYKLNVQMQSGSTLTIQPPFTIEFDITRNVLTSANVSKIRVYNLNANHRSQIRKNVTNFGEQRLIQLQAGYNNNLPIIFDGNVTEAFSVREGVNFISQIESFDGGFAFMNGEVNTVFQASSEMQTVIGSLISGLSKYGVKPGAVGKVKGKLARGNAYTGNPTNILRELSNGTFFIDNGKAYVLGPNEVIDAPVTTIDSSSGLLGTPLREQYNISIDILFEPRLLIGQKISLVSFTEDNFNGDYRVVSIKHRGTISDAVCGDAVTTVGLLGGINDFITAGAL